MGWSAAIGLGTALVGKSSADKAQSAQVDGAAEQLAFARERHDMARNDFAINLDVGKHATNALAFESGVGMLPPNYKAWEFKKTPGYDFRMSEGQRAVEGGVAARQGLNSGAAMKALTRYGQDYATNEYNNERNFHFGNLLNLSNMGQNAASGSAAVAQNYGQMASAAIANKANAQSAGATAGGNALLGGLENGINMWAYNRGQNPLAT